MDKYVCTKKCFFDVRLYEEGEILNWSGTEPPPHHFELIEGEIPTGDEAIQQADSTDIDSLRESLESLSIPFDKRWGKIKLEQALINGRKDLAAQGVEIE